MARVPEWIGRIDPEHFVVCAPTKPRFSIGALSDVEVIWDAVFATFLSAYRGYGDTKWRGKCAQSDRQRSRFLMENLG
jgi:hypothetical protein